MTNDTDDRFEILNRHVDMCKKLKPVNPTRDDFYYSEGDSIWWSDEGDGIHICDIERGLGFVNYIVTALNFSLLENNSSEHSRGGKIWAGQAELIDNGKRKMEKS